ncbi:MAG: hypothetical protein K6U80_19355 [Firmicutes bacterium]|nr:hypothetical protein [Bacillota bacterium]
MAIPYVPTAALKVAKVGVKALDKAADASKAIGKLAGVSGDVAERLHHAWPMYLGGPFKQNLQKLSKSLHDEYHSGLDKLLPRQKGSDYYKNLSPEAQAEAFEEFMNYTKAFDEKYGTNLWNTVVEIATKGADGI